MLVTNVEDKLENYGEKVEKNGANPTVFNSFSNAYQQVINPSVHTDEPEKN